MENTDFEIYKGKTFGQLCKDIVTNSEEKKTQMDILVTDLREMIKTINDATTIIPYIKEYLDVGVKNDEQLIKLAAVVQRLMSGKAGADGEVGGGGLTDEEKKQLMSVIEENAKAVPPAPKLDKEKGK